MPPRSLPIKAALLAAAFLLASCGGSGVSNGFYRGETFAGDGKHQHVYQAAPEQVCEAARAVMLGEGYVLRPQAGGNPALVGFKEFKADENNFAVLELHASCAGTAKGAVLYLTAVESRFDVRQNESSTSIGVPFTPLSIASSSTSETQVKALGQTVEDSGFYKRFYSAVARQLAASRR